MIGYDLDSKGQFTVECASKSTGAMRDLTIGKKYQATPLKYGSHDADGCLVTTEDAVKIIDDVGDEVFLSMRADLIRVS